ncbi:MAG: hypothetical protein ACREE9_14795 [Stellaceae bacterium]
MTNISVQGETRTRPLKYWFSILAEAFIWVGGLCYLDEFVFRFNRRRTRHAAFATLLGIGARTAPAPYHARASALAQEHDVGMKWKVKRG